MSKHETAALKFVRHVELNGGTRRAVGPAIDYCEYRVRQYAKRMGWVRFTGQWEITKSGLAAVRESSDMDKQAREDGT